MADTQTAPQAPAGLQPIPALGGSVTEAQEALLSLLEPEEETPETEEAQPTEEEESQPVEEDESFEEEQSEESLRCRVKRHEREHSDEEREHHRTPDDTHTERRDGENKHSDDRRKRWYSAVEPSLRS